MLNYHQYECPDEWFADTCNFREYYSDLMGEYESEALKQFGKHIVNLTYLPEYAHCVAEQYTEKNRSAQMIFEELGLEDVHAWAILRLFSEFCECVGDIGQDTREASDFEDDRD